MNGSTSPSSVNSAGSGPSVWSRPSVSISSSTTSIGSGLGNTRSTNDQRADCTCAQKDKVIIFIGPTQNGKSSLIRSILQYGGDCKQAEKIHIGDGNRSATKEVSYYRVRIDLKTHSLRNLEDGSIVDAKNAAQEYADENDHETFEESTGQHFHLLMIDTPGLDDSDQQPCDTTGLPPGSRPYISTEDIAVDIEHKLMVLQAIAAQSHIHSVCFVLSRIRSLGGTTQRLGREYLDILRHCGMKPSVHFAHTHVNRDNMFEDGVVKRPSELDQLFGYQFRHQNVNNEPAPEDSIEVCLAYQAMSNLLNNFNIATSQSCKNLRFPKPRGLTLNEDRLKVGLRTIAEYVLREKKALLSEKCNHVAAKSQLEVHLKKLAEESSDLEEQIGEIDTEDLIMIVDDTMYEPSHALSHARITYRRKTDITIRKSQVSSDYHTTHKEYLPTHGTSTCYVDAQATMWEHARIYVKLWGYKKDKFASKVTSLKEELEQTSESIKTFKKRLGAAQDDIDEVTRRIEKCEARLREIRRDQSIMESGSSQSDSVPIETALQHRHLLTGSDTHRVAKLYGLKLETPASLLPGSSADISRVIDGFADLQANFMSKMKVCLNSAIAFTLESGRRHRLVKKIFDLHTEQFVHRRILKTEMTIRKPGERATSQGQQGQQQLLCTTDTRQCSLELEPIRSALLQTCDEVVTSLEKLDETRKSRIQGQETLMGELLDELQGEFVKVADHMATKWNGLSSRYGIAQKAIEAFETGLNRRQQLSVGAFVAIRSGWTGDKYDAHTAFAEIFDIGRYPEVSARQAESEWDSLFEGL